MRILKKKIVGRNAEGFVQVQADEPEDMYHLFNLICEGDFITASTIRNVVKETNTGSTVKNRVKMQLKICAERVEFDAEQYSLRINGKNVEENEHVKLGQYHTIDLEMSRPFSIEKQCWDSIFLDRLQEACDPGQKAEIAVVVMQEGLANVCLVTSSMTLVKTKIERNIPRKLQINQAHDKARVRFFEEVYDAVKRHVNFEIVKVLIIGSPGFVKDDFMKFLFEKATRVGDRDLLKQRSKFLKAHTSSGYKHAIDELLNNPDFRTHLNDVKAVGEVRALQDFYDMLTTDPDRACYSFSHCAYADEQLAVDTLLVTDKLFKSADYNLRAKYVKLIESVKEHGGKVYVFSSLHVTGAQLDLYTGVAGTLRFPLPDIDLELIAQDPSKTSKIAGHSTYDEKGEKTMTKEKVGMGKSGGVVMEVGGSAYDSDFSASTVYDDTDDGDDFDGGFDDDDEEEEEGIEGRKDTTDDDRMREDMGF